MRNALHLFKRPIFPLLPVLLILTVAGIIIISHQCDRLNCITFSDKSRYKLREIYQESENQFRALYRHDDLQLRVNVHSKIQKYEAKTLIDGQIAQIKTQYADARAPYPGEITNTISCGKQFQPTYRQESVNGLSMTVVESFLTDRLTYGACTYDQAVKKSLLALFFCPTQNKLYQLEFIAPVKLSADRQPKYDAMLQSIRCG